MGWFAIACILGFLGFWGWRSFTNVLVPRFHNNAGTVSALIAFSTVFVGLVIWTILSQDARTPDQVADALGHGGVARFLLGVVLGAGAAFVIAERTRSVPDGERHGGGQGHGHSASGGNRSGGLPTHLVLSLGLGILALAVIAPYVDRWLPRVSGLKSPLIELQLAGSSTHKVSVSEGFGILFNVQSLQFLQNYDKRIEADITYFEKYGDNLPNKKNTVESTRRLQSTFTKVLAPVAGCVQSSIDQSWLSLDSARQVMAPTVDLLEQIIFGEEVLRQRGVFEDKQSQFWQTLVKIPETIRARINISECELAGPFDAFPKFEEHENLPYLHAAAALFISFMGDSDKALQVLQVANDHRQPNGLPMLDFRDYTFLFTMGRLSYYQGRPGDVSNLYFGPLSEMRAMALRRIEQLKQAKEECGTALGPLCYAQIYEIVATNMAAYFLAEDLARGNEGARNYTARLKEYAEEIKSAVDDASKHGPTNRFYAYIDEDVYSLLDTYAYATLVIEAGKAHPDFDLIKKDVVGLLKRVVEHGEEKIVKRGARINMFELAQLKISQANLASARELIGE